MCLTTRTLEPYIAENNIVCYKVLRSIEIKGKAWLATPYQSELVCEPDKIANHIQKAPWWQRAISRKLARQYKKLLRLFGYRESVDINGGAIHTYSSLEAMARDYTQPYFTGGTLNRSTKESEQFFTCYKYFKCIIPKGTKYWRDVYGDTLASKKIVYKEEIDPEKIPELTEMFESILISINSLR